MGSGTQDRQQLLWYIGSMLAAIGRTEEVIIRRGRIQ
jgi:hypothetical protein